MAAPGTPCPPLKFKPVEGTVFVDDQPINLRGAEALGMVAVHLDPRSPVEGFHQARVALGLIS